MMRIINVEHALWLRHINLLREMPIEKDIVYIKLVKSPLTIEGNAKHSTDGVEIYHEIESLVKINARLLVKAFSNKANFIPCNRAIEILFDVNTPICRPYYIPPRSPRNQSPSTIPNESIIFFLLRLNPLGILESLGDSAGFRDSENYGGETIFGLGLMITFLERVCMR